MRSGTCPKCGSSEVYSGAHMHPWSKLGYDWANTIPIAFLSFASLDNYVCVDCGYVESYIGDRRKLEKITQQWPRVEAGQTAFEAAQPRHAFAGRSCPHCGNPVQADWRSCPRCGQDLV